MEARVHGRSRHGFEVEGSGVRDDDRGQDRDRDRDRDQDRHRDERGHEALLGVALPGHHFLARVVPERRVEGVQWTGIVTATACLMLESGMVDAVVCVQSQEDDRFGPKPVVVRRG